MKPVKKPMRRELRVIRSAAGRAVRSGRFVEITTEDERIRAQVIALRRGAIVATLDGRAFRIVEDVAILSLSVAPEESRQTKVPSRARPAWTWGSW